MPQPPRIDTSYAPANWSCDRQGNAICAIVAHNTVGTDSRAYLKRGGEAADGSDRMVSIHRLIQKDGTIYVYLPDERGANHAGFGTMPAGYPQVNPNLVTLGFELENASDGISRVDNYPDAQLLAMGWQINEWRRLHGQLPIFRHAGLDPARRKDTVGLGVSQIEEWARRAAVYYAAPPQVYRVMGVPVYQTPSGAGPTWGWLKTDEQVEIDQTYPNGLGHLKDGRGFVDLNALKAIS